MKKLAALLPLVALLGGCALKVVEGEVIEREVFIGHYINISGKTYKKEYKTLITIKSGGKISRMGLPYYQDGPYIAEKDSITAVFGKDPEIIHKKDGVEFPEPDRYERTYDYPRRVP